MRYLNFITVLAFGTALLAVAGCQSSNSQPMGPSGSQPTAIYYYNSGFDTQANLNEWQIYQRGGAGSISTFFDLTSFNSPPRSLGVSVTGSVLNDSFVYKTVSFDQTKDIWLEFDWLLQGMSSENEVVLNVGAVNRASIGYNSSGIYLTHNGTRYYPAPPVVVTQWHHVRMSLTPSSGLSSYWFDGLNIGTNYATAIAPSGSLTGGDYIGIKLAFGNGDKVRLDNIQAYHF